MRARVLIALPIATGVLAAAALASAAVDPENDHLGPTKSAGHFAGSPQPTYEWHGCKLTATGWAGRLVTPQAARPGKGTTPKAVTFTYDSSKAPYISWKVNRGYEICGVQATVVLSNPTVDTALLSEAGYTSGPTQGSTSPTGRETIKVSIAKHDIEHESFKKYEGKTYSITQIQDVTVFVRRG